MGLMRKLASLVVEFPNEGAKSSGATPEEQADVVAAIEKVRADLEAEMKPKFEADMAASSASAGNSQRTSTSSDAAAAGEDHIPLPDILSVADVYEKVELVPTDQGFDVFKVEAMLADPEMADLALEMRARMVRLALKNMGRDLRELLTDAARRDQALDQYLAYLRERVDQVGDQVAAANARHKQELDAFVASKNAQMAANLELLQRAQHALMEFLRTKQAEEERLFRIVAPFVAPGENPVVVSDTPLADSPRVSRTTEMDGGAK